MPFTLSYGALIERNYRLKLVGSPSPGIHLLEIIKPDGSIYHFTVDGNRGFHVIKIERFRKPGDIDYETNFKLRQYQDGIWYIAEHERIRYPLSAKDGEARVEYRFRVTEAEFNIDVPDDAFKLEFPPGTKVWDDRLDMWFTVVSPGQTVPEDHLLDEPLEAAVAARAGPSPNHPEQQESDIPERGGDTTEAKSHRENREQGPLGQGLTGRKPMVWRFVVIGIVAVWMAVIYVAVAKRRAKKL